MDNYTFLAYLVSAAFLSLWVTFWYHLRMVERRLYPQRKTEPQYAWLEDLTPEMYTWIGRMVCRHLMWSREYDLGDLDLDLDYWRTVMDTD